jgi:ankyrin repeat protein
MRLLRSLLLAVLTYSVGAVSASAAGPITLQPNYDARSNLIGPRPVIRTAWVDLTTHSGSGGWWFRLQVDADGKVTRATLRAGPAEHRKEAARAALALRFKPFQVDGKPAPARFDFMIEAINEDYVGPWDRTFPTQPDPSQVRIALQRTTCFGTCPDYWVEVRGDGRVSYRGSGYVVVEGAHHWQIEAAAAARLIEQFRKADYFHLDGYYVVDVTDLPTYVTRASVGGQRKFVVNYGGAMPEGVFASTSSGPPGPQMPPAVTELENAVDVLSGVRSWVRGDETTMAKLRAAHWNFRSQAAGRGLTQLVRDCKVALAMDFIQSGAPVSVKGGLDGDTALAMAARCGDVSLVRLLASHGALSRKRDAQSFLASAVWNGYPDFVALALKHHANVSHTGDDGRPFIFTLADTRIRDDEEVPGDAKPDFAEVVRQLVTAGADPNARDKEGNVPLREVHDADVARALVRAGADPNARNGRGETPLFNTYFSDVKSALIEIGADIAARDLRGRTALFGQTHADTAKALVAAGADVNAKDFEGNTPLETAVGEDAALALWHAGATLPIDPARLSALVRKATEKKWDQLLPLLLHAAGAGKAKAPG